MGPSARVSRPGSSEQFIEAPRATERPDGPSLRLLVLNYEYPPLGGGASPVTKAVCRELAGLGHQVDVVTMAFRGLPAFEEADGLRVHRVRCLRSARHICHAYELASWIPGAYRKALQLAKTSNFDLVHSHFFLPSGVVARKLKLATGIPYVITAHGSDVRGFNPDRFKVMHELLLPAWKKVLRDSLRVTSPSQSLASLIEENLGEPHPIEIIPNGIRADWIPEDVENPAVKQKRILVVSRLFERKGVQHLFDALREFQSGWDVHIVGEGPFRAELEKRAQGLADSVTFHGWLENDSVELRDLYRTSSLFVFPSTAENFPISLLEAMISGTAIIATNLPACQEVLGDAATYVNVGDAKAIREAIHTLTTEDAERRDLGLRVRRRALDFFTWASVGRQYHELFAELAARK